MELKAHGTLSGNSGRNRQEKKYLFNLFILIKYYNLNKSFFPLSGCDT